MRLPTAPAVGALLAAAHLLVALPLDAQRTSSDDVPRLAMEAPATARSGPTWLIRSPDLRGPRVTIALGVAREGIVAVHVTEGDVVLDGEYPASLVGVWADSAAALLARTDSVEPRGGVGRTPLARGAAGIAFQLEVMGSGAERRFGLVAHDSLGTTYVMAELDASAVLLLVTQLRELAGFAAGKENADRILYALEPPRWEFQIETPAIAASGNRPPSYPAELFRQGVSGEVLVQFVVDTSGRADMRTFKVLKSSHPRFTWAVRSTLIGYRFLPAEMDGRKVAMYVQMPFRFHTDAPAFQPPPPPARPGTRRPEGWHPGSRP